MLLRTLKLLISIVLWHSNQSENLAQNTQCLVLLFFVCVFLFVCFHFTLCWPPVGLLMDPGPVVFQVLNGFSSLSHCHVSPSPVLCGFYPCNHHWYLLFTTFKCVLVFKCLTRNQTRKKHLGGTKNSQLLPWWDKGRGAEQAHLCMFTFSRKKGFLFLNYQAAWQLPLPAKISQPCSCVLPAGETCSPVWVFPSWLGSKEDKIEARACPRCCRKWDASAEWGWDVVTHCGISQRLLCWPRDFLHVVPIAVWTERD